MRLLPVRLLFLTIAGTLGLVEVVFAEETRFPRELTHWVPDPHAPIFEAAGPGTWEVKIRERGWIDRSENLWRMWYTGYDGTRAGVKSLGYATSQDGIRWTRSGDKPVYDQSWVEDVCVLQVDGTWQLFCEGQGDRAQRLTSTDGVHWEHQGPLDVRYQSGTPLTAGPFGTPTVWQEKGVWHLFYERGDRGIWLARSKDVKTWVNVQDEPVLSPGPEDYDRDLIAMNQIIRYQDRYYAVFHGAKFPAVSGAQSLWATGLAVSDDLVRWEKYAGNPLRPISENKSSGLLIHDGQKYLLYTMHGQVVRHVPSGEASGEGKAGKQDSK